LFYKRLESTRFAWPQVATGTVMLTPAQLSMRLEGLEWRRARRQNRTDGDGVGENPEKPVRQALPEHLPRGPMRHEAPTGPDCTCPGCGGVLREMDPDVTEVLERLPARFKVVRHLRPKFSCAKCETIIQAPAPSRPIAGGMAGASVIAHVLASKYCDHVLLHRWSQIYAREGVELARSTMAEDTPIDRQPRRESLRCRSKNSDWIDLAGGARCDAAHGV
jgi:transposase